MTFRRFSAFFIGIVLFSFALASCNKRPITVIYVFSVVTESTDAGTMTDSGLHDAYVTLLGDLNDDLSRVIAQGRIVEGVELVPAALPAEDERRIAEFNRYLSGVKDIEASYRERIEALEKRNGTSFCIRYHFLLARGVENSASTLLDEYHFDLKYN